MKVMIVERKGALHVREGRVAFSDALRHGTLFITVVPRNDGTHNMFDAPELEAMDSTAILVNVGRGGVVNEEAVARSLRDGQIGGFATDVFPVEPATKETSVLLDETIPNLILSPHIAWFSSKTIQGTKDVLKRNIEGFVSGQAQNVV